MQSTEQTEAHGLTQSNADSLGPVPNGMSISPIVLIIANLVPLAGVLWWGWTVSAIVIFYWSENLIVGFFNVLKMLTTGAGPAAGLFLSLFFLVHYGGFCAGHGFFVVELFGLSPTETQAGLSESWGGPLVFFQLLFEAFNFVQSIAPEYWLWGFAALFFSHGVSFVTNWLLGNERAATKPDQLMGQPYTRIVIMQVVIIFGGIGIEMLGSPLPLLLLLIGLKITFDLWAHLKEHGLSWRSMLGSVS